MLSKEDSRRLAQLERQLRRDDPDFYARMNAARPRQRFPLMLTVGAVAVWMAALVLGVVGWWITSMIAAGCGTSLVVAIALRAYPRRRASGWDRRPPIR